MYIMPMNKCMIHDIASVHIDLRICIPTLTKYNGHIFLFRSQTIRTNITLITTEYLDQIGLAGCV